MSSPISSLDMQSMITKMRMMQSQLYSESVSGTGQGNGVSFTDSLQKSLEQVNELQSVAKDKTTAFEMGEDISITEVMLAKEKASVAFEATLQIRNKVLSAYQEIMQMPV